MLVRDGRKGVEEARCTRRSGEDCTSEGEIVLPSFTVLWVRG